MQNASDFFRSIHNQYSHLLDKKKETAKILEEILHVPISDDMFAIKDSSIEFKPNPFLKSKIVIHKKEIEEKLSQMFQKKITLR